MFALRNKGGAEAVEALAASFGASRSALLKHEVAYVLGQMQDAHAVDMLRWARWLGPAAQRGALPCCQNVCTERWA